MIANSTHRALDFRPVQCERLTDKNTLRLDKFWQSCRQFSACEPSPLSVEEKTTNNLRLNRLAADLQLEPLGAVRGTARGKHDSVCFADGMVVLLGQLRAIDDASAGG